MLNILYMALILLGIVYLVDTIELLRRSGTRPGATLGLMMKMGLLKLPEIGQIIAPFIVLFAAIMTFWQLSRRQELVVIRSAGYSVWQFVAPVIALALLIGVAQTTLINPFGALLLSKYERLEDRYLSDKKNIVALFDEGLWLRQENDDGYIIIHANDIIVPQWELNDVMALFFTPDNSFEKRMDAAKAQLTPGKWILHQVVVNTLEDKGLKSPQKILPTKLTPAEIEESFAAPQTMSFWHLPSFISTMETMGFDSARLRMHFQTLLARPVFFAAMVMLAAIVALRPPRDNSTFTMIVFGVIIGFVVFFTASFLKALGVSHQIPVLLSAWSTPVICLLLGSGALLQMEDG